MFSYNIGNWNIFAMGMQSVVLKEKHYFWMFVLEDIRLVKDYFGTLSIFGFYILSTDKTSKFNPNGL